MVLYFPNTGELRILETGLTDDANWSAGLFKNDLTPDNDTVLGDVTAADFTGYAAVALVEDGPAAIDGSDRAYQLFEEVEFTFSTGTTPQDVYGWYIFDTTGNLIAIERFASPPWTMDDSRPIIQITPLVRLRNDD